VTIGVWSSAGRGFIDAPLRQPRRLPDRQSREGVVSTVFTSTNFAHGYPAPGHQTPTPQKVLDHVFFLSENAWETERQTRSPR
jgi:hypothetical protein